MWLKISLFCCFGVGFLPDPFPFHFNAPLLKQESKHEEGLGMGLGCDFQAMFTLPGNIMKLQLEQTNKFQVVGSCFKAKQNPVFD